MIAQSIKKNTKDIESEVSSSELLIESAREIAKGMFELYMSDGLTEQDYNFTHEIFHQCLLYFQRKRDEK